MKQLIKILIVLSFFQENDKIYILSQINEEWLYGRNKRGCEGMFPYNYIDIRIPLQEAKGSTSASVPLTPVGEKIRALYTFIAQEEGDLTFYVRLHISM